MVRFLFLFCFCSRSQLAAEFDHLCGVENFYSSQGK